MDIPEEHKGRFFFHFTHLKNLDSIIKNGLLCTNIKKEKEIRHVNIASENIQERRHEIDVTCGLKGKVHDYVPFYFTSRNPMLLSVLNKKNQDQSFILFLCISIEKIKDTNIVFTDASANTIEPPNFYNQPEELSNLDWANIDCNKWSYSDENRHKKMAEVLIHSEVSISDIDAIIVFNNNIKNLVIQSFKKNNVKPPKILLQGDPLLKNYFFFYSKFFFPKRKNETLITGPFLLKKKFERLISNINKGRKEKKKKEYLFDNINNALEIIDEDFSALKELEDVVQLETKNKIHTENVDDHTKSVVKNIVKENKDSSFSKEDKDILKFSGYLHDIGKGPKSKWKNGIQKEYPDHPADAIPMLERILIEDFNSLSKEEIRKICLLVIYHDLVGDIIGKGRDIEQIKNLIKNENELDLLITICLADVSSINKEWGENIRKKIDHFKNSVLEDI